LPPGVTEDDISAGVAYGVLKITIPKTVVPNRTSLRSTLPDELGHVRE
jgi:HSP20 family molecular chaperone IbpA